MRKRRVVIGVLGTVLDKRGKRQPFSQVAANGWVVPTS